MSAGATEQRLKERIRGEVRFDHRARALYATDASPYRIMPVGVVVPIDDDDVRAAVAVAHEQGLAILARGGGTSLAGQTVAEALVLDFSKWFTGLLELNVTERWVRVQPGLVRDQLNQQLAPHGLQFSPDVSTSNRANVGGMVANNSAGTRSIKYGKSVDQVIGMRVLLTDGTELELGPLDGQQLNAKLSATGREGDLYRGIKSLIDEHTDEIAARYPKVMRRVGGYNLDELVGAPGERPFNLAKLVAGSEGTLAVILELKLALQPLPKQRALSVLHFESNDKALTAVQQINRHDPSAVEMIDRDMIRLGRGEGTNRRELAWLVGDPAAVLIVEFEGDDDEECQASIASLREDSALSELCYSLQPVVTSSQQQELMKLRRDGLGIYNTVPGRAKPTPFIEDAAIPVEHLADYIRELTELCERHDAVTVFYGHASVGVIHTRPLLDMKSEAGVEKYRAISEGAFELVLKYGGSWSGEHGDGLIRSYQNRRLFGDELYQAFETVKRLFDPNWLMNPGKIVAAPALTENLRYGPDYQEADLTTTFDFSSQGGFLGAVEACVGVGDCRKVGTGTMCPSYMGTRDEEHSTRGRANVLREALTGGIPGGLTSRDVYEVLDLCLECKACKSECPSNVDMAKLKYEWLQHYHDEHGTPLATRAMGNVAKVAPLAQAVAPVSNALLGTRPVQWLLEKVVGVDARRKLPSYSRQRFDRWFAQRRRARSPAQAVSSPASSNGSVSGPNRNGPVALFADSWTMFNHVELGKAAVAVLEHLGYQVELVPYGCCGRPQLSKGLVKQAKEMARANVERLDDYISRGVPVVGLEPSCVAAFTDDYPDLLPGEATHRVATHVKLLESFLAREWTKGRFDPKGSFSKSAGEVQFHAHCHQQAVLGSSASRAVLEWVAEEVIQLDAGCCGMAGSFGYAHHDLSLTIGEQRLFPAVREFAGTTAATGFSCRHQIVDGTGYTAQHPIEVLARHLKTPTGNLS